MSSSIVQAIRNQIVNAKQEQRDETVVFLAEKLVALSSGMWEDVHELATALIRTRQHLRALSILKRFHLESHNLSCRIATSRCLLELGELKQCLTLFQQPLQNPEPNPSPSLQSSATFVRAKVFDALEHKENASQLYQESVRLDVYNYDAFQALLDGHFLTAEGASRFLKELRFGPEDAWLQIMYSNMITSSPGLLSALAAIHIGFPKSVDVLFVEADRFYTSGQYQLCHERTKQVYAQDPLHARNLQTHICCLTVLEQKNDLYLLAHTLTKDMPQKQVAWFAVGCYYLLVRNLPRARTFFQKSVGLDPNFCSGWIALGHCCSDEDEPDQAVVAYRTAARLFPGSHIPWLGMGKEALRSHNLSLADHYLKLSRQLCPNDPVTLHELGVLMYENQNFPAAEELFSRALQLWPLPNNSVLMSSVSVSSSSSSTPSPSSEPTLFNLGHTYRKLGRLNEAYACYEKARNIQPRNASVLCALGFTCHLMGPGRMQDAVEWYHRALGVRPNDSLTTTLLDGALADLVNLK